MAFNAYRYDTDPKYRAMIDGARKGGRSRTKEKLGAVARNLEKARAARAASKGGSCEPSEETIRWKQNCRERIAAGLRPMHLLQWRAWLAEQQQGGTFEIE